MRDVRGQQRAAGRGLSLFMLALLILVPLSTLAPAASASQPAIVLQPQTLLLDRDHHDTQLTMAMDPFGQRHLTWIRDGDQVMYAVIGGERELRHGPYVVDGGPGSEPNAPDIAVDASGHAHLAWAEHGGSIDRIRYAQLDPSGPAFGESDDVTRLLEVSPRDAVAGNGSRDHPAIAVDTRGGVHLVWEDDLDPLEVLFGQTQIRYGLYLPLSGSDKLDTLIAPTLLTTAPGHKAHPALDIDTDGTVQVVWEGTLGGLVELVFLVDTSGSMASEWADLCQVIYGGQLSQGAQTEGVLGLLRKANVTVLETVYSMGNQYPLAVVQGACAAHAAHQGPRTTALDAEDPSGGIRIHREMIRNGQVEDSDLESWGPGMTWACRSWKDQLGNHPGDPPSRIDHTWNTNATPIVLAVSDERPYLGDRGNGQDDQAAAAEAHDACVEAGVLPVGIHGQVAGGSLPVASYMKDVTQCPEGTITVADRACPGTSTRSTDAGGIVMEFPSGRLDGIETLAEALVQVATDTPRDIFVTVLDPWAKVDGNVDPAWSLGSPAHRATEFGWQEDLGTSRSGHLVLVNDTRLTVDDAWSERPDLEIGADGHTHLVWQDSRDHEERRDAPREVYHMELDLRGAGSWNGLPAGLPTLATRASQPLRLSDLAIEEPTDPPNRWDGTSLLPSLALDATGRPHIVWLDRGNASYGEGLVYARLSADDGRASTLEERRWLTDWTSDKLGPNSGTRPSQGMPPAVVADGGGGIHVAWTDTHLCGPADHSPRTTLCGTQVLTGLLRLQRDPEQPAQLTVEPGGHVNWSFTLRNGAPPTTALDEPVRFNVLDVPTGWRTDLRHANGTVISSGTSLTLAPESEIDLILQIHAPSARSVRLDEWALIRLEAVSDRDEAVRASLLTRTLMDVRFGLRLDVSSGLVTVTQGDEALIRLGLENTGNVLDNLTFPAANTASGRQLWGLPPGWQLSAPEPIEVEPGQRAEILLVLPIPPWQAPTLEQLVIHASSAWDPAITPANARAEVYIDVRQDTRDLLDLSVQADTPIVRPGACARWPVAVSKGLEPAFLSFSLPDAPARPPTDVDLIEWRRTHWTTDLDFSRAPGGNALGQDQPRHWSRDRTHDVDVVLCAPTDARAGPGPPVTFQVRQEGRPEVSASVLLSVRVAQVFEHTVTSGPNLVLLAPEQETILEYVITNTGNGPDRAELLAHPVTPPGPRTDPWLANVVASDVEPIQPGENNTLRVRVTAPLRAHPGDHRLVLELLSEERFEGTRQRAVIATTLRVIEHHDLQWCANDDGCEVGSIDPTRDNEMHQVAPGAMTTWVLPVINRGNVLDSVNVTLHFPEANGDFANPPARGVLGEWTVQWADSDRGPRDNLQTTMIAGDVMAVDLGRLQPWEERELVLRLGTPHDAAHTERRFAVRLHSLHGSAAEGGDVDQDSDWDTPDSNELHLRVQLRAAQLTIALAQLASDADGDLLPLRVVIENVGDATATPIVVVACPATGQDTSCEPGAVAARHTMQALAAPRPGADAVRSELILLIPRGLASSELLVVVDPDNLVSEQVETDNHARVSPTRPESEAWLAWASDSFASNWRGALLLASALIFAAVALTLILRPNAQVRASRAERDAPVARRKAALPPTGRQLPPGASFDKGSKAVAKAMESLDPLMDAAGAEVRARKRPTDTTSPDAAPDVDADGKSDAADAKTA